MHPSRRCSEHGLPHIPSLPSLPSLPLLPKREPSKRRTQIHALATLRPSPEKKKRKRTGGLTIARCLRRSFSDACKVSLVASQSRAVSSKTSSCSSTPIPRSQFADGCSPAPRSSPRFSCKMSHASCLVQVGSRNVRGFSRAICCACAFSCAICCHVFSRAVCCACRAVCCACSLGPASCGACTHLAAYRCFVSSCLSCILLRDKANTCCWKNPLQCFREKRAKT